MGKRRLRLGWTPAVLLGATLLPVVGLAPARPTLDGPDTVEEIAAQCRATGATGRALADEAIAAVARAYPCYSLWHLWESPERSLRSHRGWSHQ